MAYNALLMDVLAAVAGAGPPAPSASEQETSDLLQKLYPAGATCTLTLRAGDQSWSAEVPLLSSGLTAVHVRNAVLDATLDGTLNADPTVAAGGDEQDGPPAPGAVADEGCSLEVSMQDAPETALLQLRAGKDRVKTLSINYATAEALEVICSMPNLRKLVLDTADDGEVGAPSVQPLAHSGGLVWLKTLNVPRSTLKGLLCANRHSLTDLHLCIGTPGGGRTAQRWRKAVSDAHTLLADCRLSRLRLLVLYRLFLQHTEDGCRRQLRDLRRVLPRVVVVCMDCRRR